MIEESDGGYRMIEESDGGYRMIETTSQQPPFECDRSCGRIIEKGDTAYISTTGVICPDCALQIAKETNRPSRRH